MRGHSHILKIYELSGIIGPLNEVEKQNAPRRIYAAGETDLLRHGTRVSIVGAKAATSDGLLRAQKLATRLAEGGVTIVSGVASGIDAGALHAAMAAGGKTIAVLGKALHQTRARELQRQTDHLTISTDVPPLSNGNLLSCSLLMALVSDATIIIEAGESSHLLAQGWEAIRLARLLFIPRPLIEDSTLLWPKKMMKYGAQVLTSSRSVTTLLPVLDTARPALVTF